MELTHSAEPYVAVGFSKHFANLFSLIRKLIVLLRNRTFCHHLLDRAVGQSDVTARWPVLLHSLPSVFDFPLDAKLSFGDECVVCPFAEIAVHKAHELTSIEGSLRVGSRTWIGSHANIRAAGGAILIGNNVIIAQGVSLIASNHGTQMGLPFRDQPWDQKKTGISIGDDVWIGAGASILPGVTIGEGSIVAAGAVVTKSIPGFELWGGIPAGFIRKLADRPSL
ncbi:MAG: hypothetical protein JWN70_2590 [Planctomycetaceae bacterium]|nr:hypothetical protein [Planctomycetaceae bacterium]